MLMHPDMGFVDDGVDLASPALYDDCRAPLGQATSAPRVAYLSSVFQLLENEKVWTRDWICVGTTAEITNPGDLLPYTIGEHGLHVQRMRSGEIVGRFNKAQHGGCRVIPAQCKTGKKTKCSFTSCGYSRDRDVIKASQAEDVLPLMGQYLGMVPERLIPAKTQVMGPFIFVNVDPTLDEDCPLLPVEWSESWVRRFGFWREPRANWKIGGKALIEAARARRAAGDAAMEVSSHWHFPNLVTIRFAQGAIAVILQPTAMNQAFWRVSYFAEPNVRSEPLFKEMDALLKEAVAAAEAEQNEIATAVGENKIEGSEVGWEFNQLLVGRLVKDHVAYWNAPLTNARVG